MRSAFHTKKFKEKRQKLIERAETTARAEILNQEEVGSAVFLGFSFILLNSLLLGVSIVRRNTLFFDGIVWNVEKSFYTLIKVKKYRNHCQELCYFSKIHYLKLTTILGFWIFWGMFFFLNRNFPGRLPRSGRWRVDLHDSTAGNRRRVGFGQCS